MTFKDLLPRRLGGRDFNVWNCLYDRYVRKQKLYYIDRRLHVRLIPTLRQLLTDHLKRLAHEYPDRTFNVLEVGVGTGDNAKYMMAAARIRYYCFDILCWRDSAEAVRELAQLPNTYIFVGDSKRIFSQVVRSLPVMDLIFIDGSHRYEEVKSDWENAKLLMGFGSVCFFHDYDGGKGVKRAVDEIGDGWNVEILHPSKDRAPWAVVGKKKGGKR